VLPVTVVWSSDFVDDIVLASSRLGRSDETTHPMCHGGFLFITYLFICFLTAPGDGECVYSKLCVCSRGRMVSARVSQAVSSVHVVRRL